MNRPFREQHENHKSIFLFSTVFFTLLLSHEPVRAAGVPLQARLFVGGTKIDPAELNTELKAQSLKSMNNYYMYGVDATYQFLKIFNFGLRYCKHNVFSDELNSSAATNYQAEIKQDSALLLGRISFVDTTFLRIEAFGGFGGSNTTLKMKTAMLDGELSRKDGGWLRHSGPSV